MNDLLLAATAVLAPIWMIGLSLLIPEAACALGREEA